MNNKLDYRKIGIAVVGIIAVIFGLMKGSDVFPLPEAENTSTEQHVATENESKQIVDFDINSPTEQVEENKKEDINPQPNTDDSQPGNQRLTYEGKDLILTKHAKCRMNCRKISKDEVLEVINEGKENKRKSNPNDPRCPTIALEDWTKDGQLVRIIVADCDNVAKLVTVIDLKNEYDCYCK